MEFLFLIVIAFPQNFNGLSIGNTFKIVVYYKLQFFDKPHFTAFVLRQGLFFFCQSLRQELASTANAIRLLHNGEFKFRTPRQARALAGLLAHCTSHPTTVVSGLWELLINAVEHGNLGISYADKSALMADGQWQDEIQKRLAEPGNHDKYASVQIDLIAQQVVYTVVDQGLGFDPRPYFEFEPGRATHAHGD